MHGYSGTNAHQGRHLAILPVVLTIGLCSPVWSAPEYRLVSLGTLAGESDKVTSQARGINRWGQVAGWSDTSDGKTHAVVWNDGRIKDLGTLGGDNSFAYAISDSGIVVGDADTRHGTTHAFAYVGGRMIDLGTLGGANSQARGINNASQIVGSADTAQGDRHAFLYSRGRMIDLGTLGGKTSQAFGINDHGDVVGWAERSGGQVRAFQFCRNRMFDLGDAHSNSVAWAINDGSQTVGVWDIFAADHSTVSHAALFNSDRILDLGRLDGGESFAFNINDAGQVIGSSTDRIFPQIAFVWDRHRNMRDLYRLTDDYALPTRQWDHLGEPYGINNRGQIVGVGFKKLPSGMNCICAFLATPVR